MLFVIVVPWLGVLIYLIAHGDNLAQRRYDLAVVLALSIMGVDMTAVVLLIVVIVALLVLSARTLIQNWAAGLVLQARGPYQPGDRIETLGFIGYVEERAGQRNSWYCRLPGGKLGGATHG